MVSNLNSLQVDTKLKYLLWGLLWNKHLFRNSINHKKPVAVLDGTAADIGEIVFRSLKFPSQFAGK